MMKNKQPIKAEDMQPIVVNKLEPFVVKSGDMKRFVAKDIKRIKFGHARSAITGKLL